MNVFSSASTALPSRVRKHERRGKQMPREKLGRLDSPLWSDHHACAVPNHAADGEGHKLRAGRPVVAKNRQPRDLRFSTLCLLEDERDLVRY